MGKVKLLFPESVALMKQNLCQTEDILSIVWPVGISLNRSEFNSCSCHSKSKFLLVECELKPGQVVGGSEPFQTPWPRPRVCVATALLPGSWSSSQQTLLRTSRTQGVTNTPSIINSPALSFPRGNHSSPTADWNPASASACRTKPAAQDLHQHPATGPVWLSEPALDLDLDPVSGSWGEQRNAAVSLDCCCLSLTVTKLHLWLWGLVEPPWRKERSLFPFFNKKKTRLSSWIWRSGWSYWSTLGLCPRSLLLRCCWCL